MISLLFILTFYMTQNNTLLYDFKNDGQVADWHLVDDVVMGGKSDGQFGFVEEGYGLFSGNVSLANNGGFSSVRHNLDHRIKENDSAIMLKVKGDGKNYQFRIRHKRDSYYSYVYTFSTSGRWETIIIPLNEMYATYRGRRLDFDNFDQKSIEEIGFLIGNKKEERFRLLLDKIYIR